MIAAVDGFLQHEQIVSRCQADKYVRYFDSEADATNEMHVIKRSRDENKRAGRQGKEIHPELKSRSVAKNVADESSLGSPFFPRDGIVLILQVLLSAVTVL